jgi:hypothetical protein
MADQHRDSYQAEGVDSQRIPTLTGFAGVFVASMALFSGAEMIDAGMIALGIAFGGWWLIERVCLPAMWGYQNKRQA